MFTLKIETRNAAFQDGDAMAECARLLRQTAERLEAGHDAGSLLDINGNRVGEWKL